jgi:hypothetical protein
MDATSPVRGICPKTAFCFNKDGISGAGRDKIRSLGFNDDRAPLFSAGLSSGFRALNCRLNKIGTQTLDPRV